MRDVTALVPSHLKEAISAGLTVEVRLVPYDRSGECAGAEEEVNAYYRWWLGPEAEERVLSSEPELEWIHTASVGVDHLLQPLSRFPGAIVTNAAGVNAPSIAEWVVGSMLALEKKLFEVRENQRARRWEKLVTSELNGARVTFLGSGHVARAIATRLEPFAVQLRAVSASGRGVDPFTSVVSVDQLDRLLPETDWLIIAVPLTQATRGMIDRARLELLPPTARLVNVARGEIVDEAALIDALGAERVGGAILDVFETEPLPESSPLWGMSDVVILPHTTWRSPEARGRQIALFCENVRRFATGESLLNVVDRSRGY